MASTSNCNDDQLRHLLIGDDDAAASHLEQCPRCQLRLEQLAASPDEWQEAHQHFHGAPNDGAHSTGARADNDALAIEILERPWSDFLRSGDSHDARPPWTESMAKQLLGPPSHPEMLGRLGRYEVERLIGSGGMGIVFKAFDTELNRPVAIKVLAPHLAGSGAARQRFAREARAAAAVVHEHVVAIHNVESNAASPFLVMHYVAGESLQLRLDHQGPLTIQEILRIAHQTAAGLAAAHAQGLVHRDVKPSNILLEQGIERALLTDFGLARAADDASLTHTGYLPGTPHYMSPEQARGDTIDARSDLFSLGSLMYAMSTGRPPFRADTSFGVLRRITDTEPRPIREVNPEIPDWLAAIATRLLAKQPSQRFESATAVADLLQQCLAHVQHPDATPLPDTSRLITSNTAPSRLLLAAAALLLVLIAGIVTTTYLATHSPPPNSPLNAASLEHHSAISEPQAADRQWNTSADELTRLSQQTADLHERSDQLWDRNSPAGFTDPTETNPSEPDLEKQP